MRLLRRVISALWGLVVRKSKPQQVPFPKETLEQLQALELQPYAETSSIAVQLRCQDELGDRLYVISFEETKYVLHRFLSNKRGWCLHHSNAFELEGLLDFFRTRLKKGYRSVALTELPRTLHS